MAILLPAQGMVRQATPENKRYFTMPELQHTVGYFTKSHEWKPGYITTVFVGDEYVLIVNEDGLPLHLPPNENVWILLGIDIVGNALLLSTKEWEAFNASPVTVGSLGSHQEEQGE